MKKYDTKNTAKTGGKAHEQASRQPRCTYCNDTKWVRVSKPRDTHTSPARQSYDVVNERCQDC